jgi:hypothetical protein
MNGNGQTSVDDLSREVYGVFEIPVDAVSLPSAVSAIRVAAAGASAAYP